jgi:hypothetical protein
MFKIHGMVDTTKSFLVAKVLQGASRLTQKPDTRAPITLDILTKIMQALVKICASSYETSLFQAALNLAFFLFLHVSELTAQSPLQF